MQFLYPIGLLALAGLLIPVLIHLWNTKKGKTLKIGSIAFLSANATARSRSFQLTDLLLFVLRCLILILIAFLLTQPYLKKTSVKTKNKGWILIDKARFAAIYNTQHSSIDSLLNLGFELHDFNLGFNQFLLKDSISKVEARAKLSYNSLLNQLNAQIPSGYAAYLFADRRLNNFDGSLPKLNFKLTWKEVLGQDTLKTWSTTFLNKVYEGKSTPSVTNYIANKVQHLPTVRVAIYDPKGEDSKYIKAALNAISDFTKRKIEIEKLPIGAYGRQEADIVFWLSDQPVSSSDKQRIFSYQKGKTIKVNSTLSEFSVELKKRIVFDNLKGTATWTDGYGDPILLKETVNHFHFYSRFNPQWTDLVWNEQFVSALIPIVLGNQSTSDFGFEINDADHRVLDKSQLIESKIHSPGISSITTDMALNKIIWVMAFILLIIERILSFRNKPNLGYAKR